MDIGTEDRSVYGADDSVDQNDPSEAADLDIDGDTGADGLAEEDFEAVDPGEGDNGEVNAAGTQIFANGSNVEATANLNLRSGPSTSNAVRRTMPSGSIVKVINGVAQNGFVVVEHQGMQGFAAYRYLRAAPGSSSGGSSGSSGSGGSSGGGSSSSSGRDQAIAIAKSGVGFSYWWGHGKWQPSGATSSNKGRCSGSCPNCSHSGANGADCSGYVAKVWRVPSSNTNVANDSHPYSTVDFYGGTGGGQWSRLSSRSQVRKGDALAYRSGGAGHVLVYETGDAWGSFYALEARGCSYGIVRNLRNVASSWRSIKRSGF